MAVKKVLVVDFDVEFLKSVSLMLREEGFEIITAVDGQAGLERFEADKPDLVILEAMLPKLHGFELCARITENQSHSAPVIVITGVYRDALYKTEALRTFGATAYFEKPVDMSRLIEAVHKALGAPAPAAKAPEAIKAPAPSERPPVRPTPAVQVQAPSPPRPQPQPRPQPLPRTQAAPTVVPSAPPPAQPAKKIDADQFEIDTLLKSALAELGLEPEPSKGPQKPVAAAVPPIQPPPRPIAPPPPPKPIQPPPRPAAAPFIPPAAKPVPPPQPKPIAPTPPQFQPPAQPVLKPVPPPQPKPVVPSPPPFKPRIEPTVKTVPPPQPKPVVPPQPKPEPPPPPPPPRAKPAIVAPPPVVPAPQPAPKPVPKPAPIPEVHPAPPPLRQPAPEKFPAFEKPAEPFAHAPAVPAMDMAEKRGHGPAFTEFIAEPKKKSSPVVFITAAAIVGVAALGYFLVLKPKGRETPANIRQAQPPPVVSERASVENAPRFESKPDAKPAAKSQSGTAKPKPTPPPAVQPEPETTSAALQPVVPSGEPKLEIQVPEQTAPQATAKPATEQLITPAQRTAEAPTTSNPTPSPPAKAQTGQLVSLEEVEAPPRIVTRVEPAYPPIAFRMGVQGTVWINALVSETGNVLQAIFLRGTRAGGLDKAAETAVLKWKYQPAQKDGVNVKVWLPVRVDFVKRG